MSRTRDPLAFPIFQSMKQFSAVSGVPLAIIRKAQEMGCDACEQKRVDSGRFFRWAFNNMEAFKAVTPKDRRDLAVAIVAEEKAKEIQQEAKKAAEEIGRQVVAETLLPIRSKLETLSIRLAPLVNPSDPLLAKNELDREIAEILKGAP